MSAFRMRERVELGGQTERGFPAQACYSTDLSPDRHMPRHWSNHLLDAHGTFASLQVRPLPIERWRVEAAILIH